MDLIEIALAKKGGGITDYNDLSNKPTIPTKTSDLTNDSGFLDENDTEEADTVTIDSEVTSGSNNLITSGAVYSYIASLDGNGVEY